MVLCCHCALARNFITRHLPCMDDSVTENEFKLREIVVPVCNSVGSTGMSDGMYVGGWCFPGRLLGSLQEQRMYN